MDFSKETVNRKYTFTKYKDMKRKAKLAETGV